MSVSRTRFARALVLFAAVVVPAVVLNVVYAPMHPQVEHYVQVTFNIQKILERFVQHAQATPVFFALLAAVTIFALSSMWRRADIGFGANQLIFISLLISCLVATAALLCFDTYDMVLLYIWYPIYSFLLPCFSYVLSCTENRSSRVEQAFYRTALSVIVLASIIKLPDQMLQSQFQFAMDILTGELCNKLAEHSARVSIQCCCRNAYLQR